jgi:hypothetical protein
MMTRIAKSLSPALLLVMPGLILAQTAAKQGTPPVPATRPAAVDPAKLTAMYEDVEIMRRILNRDLAAYQQAVCSTCHAPVRMPHGSSDGWKFLTSDYYPRALGPMTGGTTVGAMVGAMTGGTTAPAAHVSGVSEMEGTYLKDYGVVFNVSMPAFLETKKSEPAPPPAKAVNDWERMRQSLRGEKPDKAGVPAEQAPDLADLILKDLADNGRNFSKLGANENLTVIVTFRQTTDPHSSIVPGFSDRRTLFTGMKPDPFKGQTHPGAIGPSSGAGDFELLGDLQVKQGRIQEAIQAYQKALEVNSDRKRTASVYQKLAQAHLKLDEKGSDLDKTISRAVEYLKLAQQSAKGAEAAPAGAPQILTSKLIVSVPKSLLDAAEKVLSFSQFRQAARVERITVLVPNRSHEGKPGPGGDKQPQ